MKSYLCELALLPTGEVESNVAIDIEDGRFVRVEPGGRAPKTANKLSGLVLPGLANVHSHSFHRALRSRTQLETGDFWSWRRRMYAVARKLDPDSYLRLAKACFAEMALSGFTSVGEFHYVHHRADGSHYSDPNEMGYALVQAAREAGIRIAVLDACYLAGGFGEELDPVQRRFSDGDASRWVARVEDLKSRYAHTRDVVIGSAIHSVRAVPPDQMPAVVKWANSHKAPLHAHVSEQLNENRDCLSTHGVTPIGLLSSKGVLGERTTAIHATHVTREDIDCLSEARTSVCLCPTTERELADGVGPATRFLKAGMRLALGSDSHAVIDPFEEARAVEMDLRLTTFKRGHVTSSQLFTALTVDGHACLGFADAGLLKVGARADLVAVDICSVRTAGTPRTTEIIFSAGAADVTDVIVDGRQVVQQRSHVLGDVGVLLSDAIATILGDHPSHS